MDAMDVVIKREIDESNGGDEMVGGELFSEEEIKKEPASYPGGESIPLFSANNNPLDIKSEDVPVEDVQGGEGLESVFFGNNDPLNIKSEDVAIVLENGISGTHVVTRSKKVHDDMVGAIVDASGNIKQENNGVHKKENPTSSSHVIPTLEKLINQYNLGKHPCEICGLIFQHQSGLKKHSIIHKDPSEIHMYKCEKCPFESKHRSSLKSHDFNRHQNSPQVKKFSCDKCDYQTNYANIFKRHFILQHSPLANAKKEKKNYKCKHCEYTGKTKFALNIHTLIHKKESELDMHKCSLCPYKSKRQSGLNNHMMVHKSSSETPIFKCELCCYESKWRHCLRNHLKVHEKNSEQLTIRKCEVCEFTTNNIYSLEVHMKSHIEKPKKSFSCYNCVYNTNDKNQLIRHMLVHRPLWQLELFECATCGVKMKRKTGLKNHIITLHGPLADVELKRNF